MFTALIVNNRSNSADPDERKSVQCLPRHSFICRLSVSKHLTRLAMPFSTLRSDPARLPCPSSRRSVPTLSVSCSPTTAPTCWPAAPVPSSRCAPTSTWGTGERWVDNKMLPWPWHTHTSLCWGFITGRREKNVSLSEEGNGCDLQPSENHQTHMLLSLSRWKWLKTATLTLTLTFYSRFGLFFSGELVFPSESCLCVARFFTPRVDNLSLCKNWNTVTSQIV